MFTGFSEASSDFLWSVRFNNYRSRFTEHKQEYLDHVQTPLKELAGEVFEAFEKKYGDMGLELHVSRIYRDARRLHNKGPYKDHLWFSIRNPRGDHWTVRPVFWFEIRPEGYAFGMGMYDARPTTMEFFRREIDRDPKPLLKLTKALEKEPKFQVDSPEYKRPKGNPPAPLDLWYNRKSIDICCERGWDDVPMSRDIVTELIEAYDFLMPFYRYFTDICVRAQMQAE